MTDQRRAAIDQMRAISDAYVSGRLAFAEFYTQVGVVLASHFDPLEDETADLPTVLRAEVIFYSRWTGGEFGEADDCIPRKPDWHYGHDTEPYAWVDQERFREAFGAAYAGLRSA